MSERVLLVANAQAGSYEGDFEAMCQEAAPGARCGSVGDVPLEAWDVVVACGGDGTVRAVVNALIATKSEAALGIVPLGTANIVSRVFGLPDDPEEALKVALGSKQCAIDVGLCDGEAFLLGCGLGLAESFVTAVGHDEKKRLGPIAYVRRFLVQRHAPSVEFRVEDGPTVRKMTGVGLVVANVAQLGPGLKPFGESEAAPDDGHLTLILLRRSHLWDLVRLGVKGLVGKASEDDALELVRVGKCRISSQPRVPIQIDGDAVEQEAPFAFDVLPDRLRVRVP